MKAACDIETSCGVKGCPGYNEGSADATDQEGKCKHALHHKLNKIDIIGVFDGKNYHNFGNDVKAFDDWVESNDADLVFHGGKFDLKTLMSKGSKIRLHRYRGDTQCLGACVFNKVTDKWLKQYNDERSEINATLPKNQGKHRFGTPLSLKTMAPFYLKVPKFWENPATHNDPEYNKLDCIYTYRLDDYLLRVAKEDGTLDTYQNYIIPWQHDLLEAEYEGVLIDEKLLQEMYVNAIREKGKAEDEVHAKVKPAFDSYRLSLIQDLTRDSEQKRDSYIANRIKNESKVPGVRDRYDAALRDRIGKLPTQFNLNSPDQMLKILTWAGINTLVDKKDKETNEWIEKEGTDKFVLKRAKVIDKNEFAAVILKYREKDTECRYLKQYIDACVGGRIYCTFNLVGTRTGRLSSSGPNLQNVKGSLRAPFIIADPTKYSVYTVDSSQIEPRLIAYLTGDKQMVTLFMQGRDYHNFATKKFFPTQTQGVAEADIKKAHVVLRKTAKTGDLSIIYGTAEFTFQTMCLVREELHIPLEDCKTMIDSFRGGMTEVLAWKKRLEDSYKNGTKIKNRFGYPVQANGTKIHMTLFNTFIQGQASQMIFHSAHMAKIDLRKKGYDVNFLLLVHDEVVWRFPKGQETVCQNTVDFYMKNYKLDTPHGRVPLDCEGNMGDRWMK